MPKCDGWCVEFGAWDGRHLSNTALLIDESGYRAVLIEADEDKFRKLAQNYAANSKVIPLQRWVGFTGETGLDSILKDTDIPHDFDFLSIDIDGCDYQVWQAITKYRPKIVCIEFNPTIPTEVRFVQSADPTLQEGSSLAALVELGEQKGYRLICVLRHSAFFVADEYFGGLGRQDVRASTLRQDTQDVTYLFSTYDGRVVLQGARRLPWHGMKMAPERFQLLPSFLRRFPGGYRWWQWLAYALVLLVRDRTELQRKIGRWREKRGA